MSASVSVCSSTEGQRSEPEWSPSGLQWQHSKHHPTQAALGGQNMRLWARAKHSVIALLLTLGPSLRRVKGCGSQPQFLLPMMFPWEHHQAASPHCQPSQTPAQDHGCALGAPRMHQFGGRVVHSNKRWQLTRPNSALVAQSTSKLHYMIPPFR